MKTGVSLLSTGGMILDSVVTSEGEVSLEAVGGNAVYSAAGAALWAADVALAANIPANYPQRHLDALARYGVRLDAIQRHKGDVTEPEWFLHRADGSRIDHVYAPSRALGHRSGAILSPEERSRWQAALGRRRPEGLTFGAFRALHPVSIEQVSKVPLPVIVHLAPEAMPAQVKLACHFRERGAIVSLDPGFAAVRDGLASFSDLLPLLDIFLPSQRELEALLPGRAPADAMRELRERTPATIALKLGAAGSMVLAPNSTDVLSVPALHVAAKDPVGAGDAYCGGFAAAWAERKDPRHAAYCGTVSASFAVELFGATSILGIDPTERAARYHKLARPIESEAV